MSEYDIPTPLGFSLGTLKKNLDDLELSSLRRKEKNGSGKKKQARPNTIILVIVLILNIGLFLYHHFGKTLKYFVLTDLVTTLHLYGHPAYTYCTKCLTAQCTVQCTVHCSVHCTVHFTLD